MQCTDLLQLARCTAANNNNNNNNNNTTSAPSHGHPLHWDPAKITVAPDVAADRLFLRNVARGLIVTGKVWPLVFSSSSTRRQRFPGPLTTAPPSVAASRWSASAICGSRAIRRRRRLATRDGRDVLEDSFLPAPVRPSRATSRSSRRRSCRVVSGSLRAAALEMEIGRDAGRHADGEAETDGRQGGCEAGNTVRPSIRLARRCADGAAEPLRLSYPNFESILPLDRILRRPGGAQPSDSQTRLSHFPSATWTCFSGTLSGTDLPLLYPRRAGVSYLEPANSGQRGGKRMIFNSAALAHVLFKIMSDDENNDSDDDDDDDEDSVVDNGTVVSGVSDSDSLCKDFDGDSSADSADVLSDHCDAPTKPSLTQGGVSSVEAQIVSASESTADATVRETEADENGYGETSPPSEIDNAAEEQGGQTEDIDADSETASHLDGESETSRSENGASQLNESPWATSNRFCFVNDVFRLNKFEPTDRRFRLHRDTPYYDGVRGLVSKYTMLIYLSAGETPSGSLTIYDGSDLRAGEEMGESDSKKCVVENIASAQCIIFDQRYPHEGDPFDSGAKIFLRTELIYWLPRSVKHVPRIGLPLQLCNLDSDDLEPVLFKKVERAGFRPTDGYSYWFPMPSVSVGSRRESGAGPIIAGTSIEQYISNVPSWWFLTFSNGKLSEMGDSFRKDCKTTSAIPPKRSTAASLEATSLFDRSDLDCCLYHGRDPKPWTCKHSFDEYVCWMETAPHENQVRRHRDSRRELSYDPEAVVVCGNAVRFCGKDLGRWGVPSFNFAACQSFGDFERSFVKRKYVGLRAEMSGCRRCRSSLSGAKTGGVRGVRFRAEFFKNDWAVSIKGGDSQGAGFHGY
ncbi:hypothetical protein DFJ73DRAFT_864934 [Zopfochytrium polystomum]|nr:hypothetical protein DFJ73DRAFT_864934 [Zopfochytrium polystomum]